jgi:predicted regulator of Ras-like GTPase activity (Roadblock/LC7/MglB family)
MAGLLEGIQARARGVRSLFMATVQGSFVASTQISGVERMRLGGFSAGSLAIGSRGLDDLSLGELSQVRIMGSEGAMVLLRVGEGAVLTLVVDADADIDQIVESAKRELPKLVEAL